MTTCSITNCSNKTFNRSKMCPTHIHRKKRGIDLNLPIRYMNHGYAKSTTYYSWGMMKNRCTNPKAADWKYYGGRGIKLCKRWMKFENFLEDMGPKPSPDLSIDRINVNGNYTPKNCRWATHTEQSKNRRLLRTHCIRGHEFNEQNTYTMPGRRARICRQCYNLRMQKWRKNA